MTTKIDEIIGRHKNSDRKDLLDVLQEIQEIEGYISKETITKCSHHFKLATSKVYGIASFYDEFKFVKQGKFHIKVCNGTSCHIADNSNLRKELEKLLKIEQGECTRDGMFSIEYLPCMGACGLSPLMSINNEYYTSIQSSEIKDLLENFKKQDINTAKNGK